MRTKEKERAQSLIDKTKGAIVDALDENGNGVIDLEDVLVKGLKIKGIKIDRAEFLQKSLCKLYPQSVIDRAIAESPMKAHVPLSEIDKLADETIKYERACVSGISAALGLPGGLAMVATIPADIAQYYGYLLRTMQKLLYLYGFPQIETNGGERAFDDATMNVLILCFGVMHGVAGANCAVKALAQALGTGVEKRLMRKALTKGTLYPIVVNVSKWFGVKMTKRGFAGFFKKAIPIVGGVIGGGLTYASFKPCCDALKKTLRDTILSNPKYKPVLDDVVIDEQDETGTV